MSKRFICLAVASLAAAILWMGIGAQTAMAHKEFKEVFVKEYVKADSTDPKDMAFAKAANTASCAICHSPKDKKIRNAYGKVVEKFLTGVKKSETDKIKEGLEKAAEEHTVAGDATSPTYGDKIADGKLPFAKKEAAKN